MPFDSGSRGTPDPTPPKRPEYLFNGWRGFIGRVTFALAFLTLLTMIFLGATGLAPH